MRQVSSLLCTETVRRLTVSMRHSVKVTSGMEYVDKIAETETHSLTNMGMDDVPVQTQIIKTIVIK